MLFREPLGAILGAISFVVMFWRWGSANFCLQLTTLHYAQRHILPNALSPIMISATLDIANVTITESALSFWGLGFPPNFPTLGCVL